MQSVATHPPAASSNREGAPVFSVVLAFEDFNTGKRAKRAYDFLAANLTHDWQVTNQMWKFEMLSIPELREIAAKDAAMANLIIVSSRGDRELPVDVKDWVEMWLGYRGDAVALVALFDSPPEQAEHAQATQTYLERVAKRGQMEFFTWPEVGLGGQSWRASLILDPRSEMAGGPLLASVMVAPREAGLSHCGINE
jgi:hypothetical protein